MNFGGADELLSLAQAFADAANARPAMRPSRLAVSWGSLFLLTRPASNSANQARNLASLAGGSRRIASSISSTVMTTGNSTPALQLEEAVAGDSTLPNKHCYRGQKPRGWAGRIRAQKCVLDRAPLHGQDLLPLVSGHSVTFQSSPTVLADTPTSRSTSTRILSGKPPRAMWSVLYLGVADRSYTFVSPTLGSGNFTHSDSAWIGRVGLNVKLGFDPAIPTY
jgi:hypothetical protein